MERSKSTSKTRKIKEETKICRKMTSPNNFNKIANLSKMTKKSSLKNDNDFKRTEDFPKNVLDEDFVNKISGQFQNSKRNICINLKNLNSLSMSTTETLNINNKLKNINDLISKSEKNISDLKNNYDHLINRLNLSLSQNEYENVNNDINIINITLKNQNEKLNELKNYQKDLNKRSCINIDNL